ncbi:MAG: NUDIX hydrolase [Rickettsiales bacterium]|nr:NUDIX hydrolase [Rickettsiales bacterium]
MIYSKGIEVGVIGVILNDDMTKVLVCIGSPKRGWHMPGGHMEPGETSRQAVIRETKEEVGIDIDILHAFPVQELIVDYDGIGPEHVIVFPYIAKIKPGQDVRPDGVEILEAKWVSLDEAESLMNKLWAGIIAPLRQWLNERN